MTVVAIDDRSVLEYGRWPWPRAVQAELFMAILNANPSVLGVDIIYSELDDAWADSRLARAFGRAMPGGAGAREGPATGSSSRTIPFFRPTSAWVTSTPSSTGTAWSVASLSK